MLQISETASARLRQDITIREHRPRPNPPTVNIHKQATSLLTNVTIVAIIGFGGVFWQVRSQHQSDQQRALDQTLQTYIDDMRDLLLNRNLTKSTPGAEVRQVARAQTLNTLRILDADRNIIVLRFLRYEGLIGMQDAVINLSNADLSTDKLNRANLSGIDLTAADLSNADLDKASLSHANLSDASMYGATLTSAHLNGANLCDVTLTGALLNRTIMNRAILTGAHLNGASLTHTQLIGADLSDADLNGANLAGADLISADLSYANLSNAGLTQQQLNTVNSCTKILQSPESSRLTCQHTPKITLTYWYTESLEEKPVIINLINKFEQANPEIKISYRRVPFELAQANFLGAAQEDQANFLGAAQEREAPDVFRSAVGWVAQFASQRYLLNIDSQFSQTRIRE